MDFTKKRPSCRPLTPKDQKPGDQGKKTWRFGEKPGSLSTASKKTKISCREDLKSENGSLRIRLTGYQPSHSVLNFVFTWICLRTVDFYISDAWKSIFRGKNENIQKVYSIGLWICLLWDFCASWWDHETVLRTVRLERSALGWGEGCPMLWQIYAWHCIVMKILYKIIRIKNKKYNEKLNKAMHKFVRVLDKYGWGRGGGLVCMSLVWISSMVISHFEE